MPPVPALPTTFVVDCTIIAAIFLPDEQSPFAAAVRERCADLTLVAPRLLRVEFANVALTARRRARLDEAQFRALIAQGMQFPVLYENDEPSLVDYAESAFQLDLTSYDYAYLDCARRRSLPLATLDRALVAAARRAGVDVLTDAPHVAEARPSYPAHARRAPTRAGTRNR